MRKNSLSAQAASISLAAASYIRHYGWRVEGMSRYGQPRCSMGALASAHPPSKWNQDLASLMYEVLYNELNGMTLTQFNHRTRDGNRVALLYERVASSLRANQTITKEAR